MIARRMKHLTIEHYRHAFDKCTLPSTMLNKGCLGDPEVLIKHNEYVRKEYVGMVREIKQLPYSRDAPSARSNAYTMTARYGTRNGRPELMQLSSIPRSATQMSCIPRARIELRLNDWGTEVEFPYEFSILEEKMLLHSVIVYKHESVRFSDAEDYARIAVSELKLADDWWIKCELREQWDPPFKGF